MTEAASGARRFAKVSQDSSPGLQAPQPTSPQCVPHTLLVLHICICICAGKEVEEGKQPCLAGSAVRSCRPLCGEFNNEILNDCGWTFIFIQLHKYLYLF